MCTEVSRVVELQERIIKQQKRIAELEQNEKQNKNTIHALKASKILLDNIFNVAPAGIGMVRRRVFMEANPMVCEITGYTHDELIGQSSRIIYKNDEDYDYVGREKYLQIKAKGTGKVETVWKRKDGSLIDVVLASTPVDKDDIDKGTIFTVLDISEQKRAKKHLKSSEELQEVIYNISNAVNSTDNLNKLVIQIRNELSAIIDTTNFFIALYDKADDTLTLPFFIDEKDKFESPPAGKSLTAHVIRTKAPLLVNSSQISEMENQGLIEAFGSDCEIWLGVPLETDNEVIGVLAVQSYTNAKAFNEGDMKMLEFVSDQISLSIHRKNTEIKMAEALEKATESDRLKSSFLANMSHEIRTPMNGVLGFANVLKQNKLSEEERTKYISIIEQSGKRMLGVINDLIDISKIESGTSKLILSDFNLNNSFEYVYSFFKPEAEEKGLKLSYGLGSQEKNFTIRSDREKVYAILINLVKNAIKYTDSGSIHFSYKIKNNIICIEVTDTGIGIPKEKQKLIFNRFMQTDITLSSNYEGVGLGLAITKAYIKLLGGTIGVESEDSKGSTFFVEIPFSSSNNKPSKGEKKETVIDMGEQEKNKIKILLAEDDTINRKLFTYILKDTAKELILTVNGAEAVEKHTEISDIDVVLMDLKMPEMDGYEATRLIREKDKDIKIIGLSAFALETEKNKALENGFDDYISKPVSKATLLNTLGKYFEI